MTGVQFAGSHRLQLFGSHGLDLNAGDRVYVRTTDGLEIGEVVIAPSQIVVAAIEDDLPPVVRMAGAVQTDPKIDPQVHSGEARWTIEAEADRFTRTGTIFPRLGSRIETDVGPVIVSAVDIRHGKVTATADDGETFELPWIAASDEADGQSGASLQPNGSSSAE